MIFKKTFKYRLSPTNAQLGLFLQFAGAARWVYNRFLDQRTKLWKEEQKSISRYDQINQLVPLKKEKETSWLKEIHSQVLQQALFDLQRAFDHFFRRVRSKEVPGYPKFRTKGENDSFRYPQGVKVTGNRVYLPKIGFVKFKKSREIEGEIKEVTVIQEGFAWYICFSCEIERELPNIQHKNVIGIDLGIEHFAMIAKETGIEEIENRRFLNRDLKKLKYLSRRLSKKQKKSQNRLKAKYQLAKIHARIRSKRSDFLHKLSTHLVQSHDLIVVESLQIKALLEDAPKALARAIGEMGWRSFLQMLEYKCRELGKKLEAVGKYFPSTKQCFKCKKKNALPLSQRRYSCSCGFETHRDHNAALNLRAAGMSVLKLVELPR